MVLGEILLASNKPSLAFSEFEASLVMAPNRLRTFYGMAGAAEKLGNRVQARNYYQKIVAACSQAGSGVYCAFLFLLILEFSFPKRH